VCNSNECCCITGAATSGVCFTCGGGSYSASGQSTCTLCVLGFDENTALYAPCLQFTMATTGTTARTSAVTAVGGIQVYFFFLFLICNKFCFLRRVSVHGFINSNFGFCDLQGIAHPLL
jgi:hypothetical protein